MAKARSQYRCSECHHVTAKWVGRCPDCGTWGTVDEVAVLAAVNGSATRRAVAPTSPAVPISSIDPGNTRHFHTGVSELDRVLGGGLVPGSVTLLAGDPGVGKSTLLLEVAHRWAQAGRRALYLSGEESAGQIRLRAERTRCTHDEVYLAAESDVQMALGHIDEVRPSLVVVDSVQTMSTTETDGVTGGVTQVRAVTTALTMAAKTSGVAMLLVGHVTKDGAIAGPRSLEHLVDVVLHFEGDRTSSLRMVRGVKNRFGAADEVGCFLLHDNGIECVADPSGLFLDQRPKPVSGTAVTVTLDGKRPLIGEVQALIGSPASGSPRRAVSGIDSSRAAMITAVLEKRARLSGRGQRHLPVHGRRHAADRPVVGPWRWRWRSHPPIRTCPCPPTPWRSARSGWPAICAGSAAWTAGSPRRPGWASAAPWCRRASRRRQRDCVLFPPTTFSRRCGCCGKSARLTPVTADPRRGDGRQGE